MRWLLWLALVLSTAAVFVFGVVTSMEPSADPADAAEIERRAAAEPTRWPTDAVARHLAQRAAHAEAYSAVKISAVATIGLVAGLMLLLGLRKRRALRVLAGVTAASAIGVIIFSPTFEMGLYGPPPPRDLALLFGLPALVASVTAVLLTHRLKKRVTGSD